MVYRIFVLWVLLAVSSTQAEDWPQWRGPYFNGSTSEKGLPAEWSTTDNIAWSVTLPGAAASTPIVWEQRVFLSGVDSGRDMLQAMCFDRVSGNAALESRRSPGSPARRSQQQSIVIASDRWQAGGFLLRQWGSGLLRPGCPRCIVDKSRSPGTDIRSTHAGLLRWRLLRAQRFAELPVPRRGEHRAYSLDRPYARDGQVRSLAAGGGREDLPDQLQRGSRRAERDPR